MIVQYYMASSVRIAVTKQRGSQKCKTFQPNLSLLVVCNKLATITCSLKALCCDHASFCREDEIDKGTELTAALVNTSVDLKFFPDAPSEAENRVSFSRPFLHVFLV